MQLPFAFSVSHFVSSVGADAGFAAIIGLAILVLLYFAQARETTTLRDEATSANQRVGELERRVAQLGRPGVAPAPRPVGAPAEQAGGPQQAAALSAARPATAQAGQRVAVPQAAQASMAIPAAPAGVGAPALIDATRLIPTPAPAPTAAAEAAVSAESLAPSPEPKPEPRPAPAAPIPTAPAAATPPPATAAAGSATRAADSATGAAVTGAPPGANGTGEHAVPQPVGAPASARGPQQDAPPRRVQIGSGGSLPPSLSIGGPASQSPARRWLPALLGVLIVGAIVAVLLVVTSTGGNKSHTAGASRTTNAPAPARAFKPSSVTVAVLNGTDVSQLAHHVAKQLVSTGYREGAVATAAEQTHTSTTVGYLRGFKHDGVEVASALKLPTSSVHPADQSAQAVACPPPGACRANVIVTVGSDLASSP